MKILLNNSDLNEALSSVSNLGFVPTMGSLHRGHISLIKKSLKVCNKTIVSIFINPTQFNNHRDFKNYPRNNKRDLLVLKKLRVDYVYLPNRKNIYNFKRKIKIRLKKSDKILCANYRQGHFEGVLDVMDRLISQIQPKKIFMGEKDYQQLYLVKKYTKKKFRSKIIACKTIRDKNKLALSSRNSLLNKVQLIKAGQIARDIILFKKKIIRYKDIKKKISFKKRQLSESFNINIEYFELRNIKNLKNSNKTKNSRIFIAYYLNKIRLIDNF